MNTKHGITGCTASHPHLTPHKTQFSCHRPQPHNLAQLFQARAKNTQRVKTFYLKKKLKKNSYSYWQNEVGRAATSLRDAGGHEVDEFGPHQAQTWQSAISGAYIINDCRVMQSHRCA